MANRIGIDSQVVDGTGKHIDELWIDNGDGTYSRKVLSTGGGPATITDGTNTANVLKSDGTAAGQNAQIVSGTYLEKAGLTAGALNADLLPALDVSNYRWFSLHITAVATGGTLTIQGSNDNVNFVSVAMINITGTAGSITSGVTTTGLFHGPIAYRYLRIRQTAWGSGTTIAVVELYTAPIVLQTMGVSAAQNGNWVIAAFAAKGIATTANGTTVSPSIDASFGTVTNHCSKASIGNIFSARVSSVNTALVYFQIFNKASAPAGADVPIYSFAIPAGTATVPAIVELSESFFGLGGKNMATGLAWGISSTAATFTDAGTAGNYQVHVHYA